METKSPESGDPAARTILVADDEEMVRKLAVTVLKMAGYTTLVACDGQEACELFEQHVDEIDLAFLDVVMPRKDGKAVYEAIVAVRPELPVIFASGYGQSALEGGRLSGSEVSMIQKPYTPSSLLGEIRKALGEQPPD